MESAPGSAATDAARRALEGEHTWYHTIELAPGVLTPGQVDLRGVASRLLPSDLDGRRALDVGTFDGFWAFELERRGADTVAIDVDELSAAEWPPMNRERLERQNREWGLELGRGFRLAAEALGSSVERVVCNVYDLDVEVVGGPVDLAFVGSILLHLRDPVRALERVRETLAPGGELRLMEPVDIGLTLRHPRRPVARFQPAETSFNWWYPNLGAVRDWIRSAGFEDVERTTGVLRPSATKRMRQSYLGWRATAPAGP